MNIGIIGCGYVSAFYVSTMPNHSNLTFHSVFDLDKSRAADLANPFGAKVYTELDTFLADPELELVVNLTPPEVHASITKECLLAGKHVYSEKPMAESVEVARKLQELAKRQGLMLAGAPSTVLGEPAQTLWRELRKQTIGKARLVYAELDDGLVHKMGFEHWISQHGAPWPWENEFKTGCVKEHAAYHLSWLITFFGSVKKVVSWAGVLEKDKGIEFAPMPPDFSSAILEFESGCIARLTCGVIAERDRQFRVFGDQGVLEVGDCWNYNTPVILKRHVKGRPPEEAPHEYLQPPEIIPMAKPSVFKHHCGDDNDMDFARGVSEFGNAIACNSKSRLDSNLAIHIIEVIEALEKTGETTINSRTEQAIPMPWAV